MTTEQLDKLAAKARQHISAHFGPELVYHNIEHIEHVVKLSRQLAQEAQIKENEQSLLIASAWLHDIAYDHGSEGHEQRGTAQAKEWCEALDVPNEEIEQVQKLILATAREASPETQLERLMKDADMGHMASEDYHDVASRLRKEWESTSEHRCSDTEWLEMNLEFFKSHKFYSEAGKTLLNEGKKRNLKMMKKASKEQRKKTEAAKEEKKMAKKSTEKGRETVFRVALRNHIQLSKIADNKANIMLSVNAIIISVILGNLLSFAQDDVMMRLPLLILMITCIVSIILSTLSTIPKVTEGSYTRKEVEEKKVNLLFFGNFHAMPLKDYQWGMSRLLDDEEYLYGAHDQGPLFPWQGVAHEVQIPALHVHRVHDRDRAFGAGCGEGVFLMGKPAQYLP